MAYRRQHQGDCYLPIFGKHVLSTFKIARFVVRSLIMRSIDSNCLIFACRQHGSQCFCGVDGNDFTRLGESGECLTPCTGDDSETCGGSNAMNVYYGGSTPGTTPAPTPTPSPVTGAYSYLRCFEDSRFNRVLTAASYKGQIALTIAVRKLCVVYATVCSGCGHRY